MAISFELTQNSRLAQDFYSTMAVEQMRQGILGGPERPYAL